MRQLTTGVVAFEVFAAVDVVAGVHQPVGIEYDNGIYAQLTTATADLDMTVDGRLAKAFLRTLQLG